MTEYETIDEARDGEKPWRDEDLMRELYHDKKMSQDEIAAHFDGEIIRRLADEIEAALEEP